MGVMISDTDPTIENSKARRRLEGHVRARWGVAILSDKESAPRQIGVPRRGEIHSRGRNRSRLEAVLGDWKFLDEQASKSTN